MCCDYDIGPRILYRLVHPCVPSYLIASIEPALAAYATVEVGWTLCDGHGENGLAQQSRAADSLMAQSETRGAAARNLLNLPTTCKWKLAKSQSCVQNLFDGSEPRVAMLLDWVIFEFTYLLSAHLLLSGMPASPLDL